MTEKIEENRINFLEYLKRFTQKFDRFYNQKYFIKNTPKTLKDSIHYINSTGGKRIRPFLVNECANLFEVEFDVSIYAAIAIEMVHTYSLIHDDLPSMDDDDMRRGKETLHKKYNEATAILSGDALLTDSFNLLVNNYKNIDQNICIELISLLSKSAGSGGMVGGQVLDLFPKNKNMNSVNIMNEMKTGALISCATCFGSILGKGSTKDYENMYNYGSSIGKIFQIKDDLLDIEGDERKMGKKANKDSSRGKQTLISLIGRENAKKKSELLVNNSKKILKNYGEKANRIIDLTNFVISRNN